jgi:Arc/MetJ-type ribon-helix-helix transcriptional regulator
MQKRGNKMRAITKAKVTVSLDADLLAAVDERVKQGEARSRSAVVEDILRQWRQEELQKQLERDIEAYYLSMTEEEKEEDRRWAEFAARAAAQAWEEDEKQWTNRVGAKSTSSNSPTKRKRARR